LFLFFGTKVGEYKEEVMIIFLLITNPQKKRKEKEEKTLFAKRFKAVSCLLSLCFFSI